MVRTVHRFDEARSDIDRVELGGLSVMLNRWLAIILVLVVLAPVGPSLASADEMTIAAA